MNQYEAMFLFDPTFGSSFENCEAEIRRLMERAQAEIILCRRWDERRLAYKVNGRKRGVYVLVYFKARPDKIVPLERDVQISENVLRVLVLRADGVTQEMMERAASAHGAEPTVSPSHQEAPARNEPPTHDKPAEESAVTETAVAGDSDEKTVEKTESASSDLARWKTCRLESFPPPATLIRKRSLHLTSRNSNTLKE